MTLDSGEIIDRVDDLDGAVLREGDQHRLRAKLRDNGPNDVTRDDYGRLGIDVGETVEEYIAAFDLVGGRIRGV